MGTLVNAAAVALGGLIGLLIRKGLPERVEAISMQLLGLSVFVIGLQGIFTSTITVNADGAGGALQSGGALLLIASLVVGGVIGELLDIDGKLNRAGKRIEQRFGKEGFAKGFISGSLIYCIGALAIIGALNDGLTGDSSMLFVKSALDFICSIILGSTLGFGVIFAFIPVLIYQGGITLFAGFLAPLISDALMGNICMVGYCIVMCIGINFLKFAKIRTANLLPCLLIPVVYELISPLFAYLPF